MKIICEPSWLMMDIFDVFHMFLPKSKYDENKPFVSFNMQYEKNNASFNMSVEFEEREKHFDGFYEIDKYKNELEEKRYIKRAVKKFIYENLSKHFNKNLPWGSLTGIRPTKIAYELIDKGLDKFLVKDALISGFCVSEDKALLTEKIVKNQTCIIKNEKLVDLYINIPFCPSRCYYCSFISAEYDKVKHLIPNYLDALKKEIDYVKTLILKKNFIVRSVYIGGGTPSVLEPCDLKKLLSYLCFNVDEFTVECGRPDTITKEKLDILKQYGVTRISINPQTFVDATLRRIGRKHTANDVINAYKLAIDYDFSINMDLIAGLTGESLRGFKKSVQTAVELSPDNITIHTLALKRGSTLCENESVFDEVLTEKMVTFAEQLLLDNGYKPYYLYKLKNQSAGLENVGYFRDKLCKFNVDSMEETNTIIACGAGAITKRIFYENNKIERQANCKFANDYIARIDEMIEKKEELFNI